MATVAATNPTMLDIAKLMGPDGQIVQDVGELLNQINPMYEDIVWEEANGGTYHRHSQRTGIPEPTWRRYYEGVSPTKSTYAQLDEPIGMMENRSVVDEDLVKHSGNPGRVRLLEAKGIIEGFDQAFTETLLYGDVATAPAKFNGVMSRYDALVSSAASGENVIDAGGTGSDNASILVVKWASGKVFGIYPRGTPVGLQRQDLGVQQITTSDSPPRRYSAYEEIFKWQCGLVVQDWRNIVRIANIDKSALVAQSGAAALLELLAIAVDKLPAGDGRTVIYMNRTLRSMLRIQTMKQSNVHLMVGGEEGRKKLMFDEIPIRIVDMMQADEARVT